MIRFEKKKLTIKLKDPFLGFKVHEQEIELRKDPLTGRTCRINVERSKRPHQIEKVRKGLEGLIRESKKKCPFCEDNILKSTPKFVDFKERFFKGESVLFPNLYPFGLFHATVVFTAKKHFLKLNEISQRLWFDSLRNAIDFLKLANERKRRFRYPNVSFNYLPPAGASIVHPHFQVVLDMKPTSFCDLILKKSLAYYKRFNSNFWRDLVREEKRKKERFIGKLGNLNWIANFAPIKSGQISGILDRKISSITALGKKELKGLAEGISGILKRVWVSGVRSMNLSILSGPIGENISDFFTLHVTIIPRPNLFPYASDMGFMEILHQEPVIDVLPEDVAKSLRLS